MLSLALLLLLQIHVEAASRPTCIISDVDGKFEGRENGKEKPRTMLRRKKEESLFLLSSPPFSFSHSLYLSLSLCKCTHTHIYPRALSQKKQKKERERSTCSFSFIITSLLLGLSAPKPTSTSPPLCPSHLIPPTPPSPLSLKQKHSPFRCPSASARPSSTATAAATAAPPSPSSAPCRPAARGTRQRPSSRPAAAWAAQTRGPLQPPRQMAAIAPASARPTAATAPCTWCWCMTATAFLAGRLAATSTPTPQTFCGPSAWAPWSCRGRGQRLRLGASRRERPFCKCFAPFRTAPSPPACSSTTST